MGNFQDDLKKGKEAEKKVMEALNKEDWYIIPNPNEKEMDLIICRHGIEVKMDDKATYTGNFYIEFECNGRPSGIFREERIELTFWVHCTSTICYMIAGDVLRGYVIEMIEKCRQNKTLTHKGIRLVEQGGNGGRTKGLLIPVEKFKEMSYSTINI